ncbi:hypothetical protein [Pseudomonas sp. BF-R-24]|nr:hypothetical protein [Pseudomonas sp. BF-R-24]
MDSQRAQSPPDGLLEIVAHPNQLGADFGDAYLEPGITEAYAVLTGST